MCLLLKGKLNGGIKMKNFEEKILKRWLKRKVKITLATIVAFLIGSSLSLAETLYIKNGENGVEFSIDNQNWGENPYSENSFENNIYTNNRKIESDYIGIYNKASNISLINENKISVDGEEVYGIYNNGAIEVLKNNGLIEVNGVSFTTGILNLDGKIEEALNQGTIKLTSSTSEAYGIDNQNPQGIIDNLTNQGIIDVTGNLKAYGIQNNGGGTINDLLNQGIIKVESLSDSNSASAKGIANGSNLIENISNEGIIEVAGVKSAIGIDFSAKKETKNKGVIKVDRKSVV